MNSTDGLNEIMNLIENLNVSNTNFYKYEDVPNESKNMIYCEELNRYFYDLEDLFDVCEEEDLNIPEYVYGTQTDMIHINADYIVEEACEDLHEDAYESIDYTDIKKLQKMLDDWCKEQTCTVTYYPDYIYAIKVCRDDG